LQPVNISFSFVRKTVSYMHVKNPYITGIYKAWPALNDLSKYNTVFFKEIRFAPFSARFFVN